jgi:DNA-binding MarR family transcriptional regulator
MGTRWLTDDEQRVWRQWLALSAELPAYLGQQLQQEFGISHQDYTIFVTLSEAPEPALRISAVAELVGWERSRLSHHLTRMEKRGLVERRECTEDGRGAYVMLTPLGRETLERAAPSHVETVRQVLFDRLDEADVAALGRITSKILDGLREQAGQV